MISKPTAKQLAWQDMELGVIIHWCADIYDPTYEGYKTEGVRTYLSPEKFGDAKPDAEQWVRSAYELGAKYAVLVTNHCTGFSVWPTKENDYSVASIKWKDGKGDVIADFIEACKKYDIKPGLYYSTGCNGYYNINDEWEHDYFAPYYREYVKHVENQLTEIWTNYGELFEVWFDGGIIPVKDGGPAVFDLLQKYQPDVITFQGPEEFKHNIRWIGNEDGVAPDNCRCCINGNSDSTGDLSGSRYVPAEADFPNRTHKAFGGGWTWAKNEEQYIIPPEELFRNYLNTVGHNTNMLLGMGISTDGDFKDEQQFIEFGKLLKKEFADEINCKTTESENELRCVFENRSSIRYIVIREDLTEGQTISGYEVLADGKVVYRGENIGHKRIIPFQGLEANEICVKITSSIAAPVLRDVKIYK